MAKSFTPREIQLIHDALILKGKVLFAVQGLKKTTVDDLTAAAGIAKGSFYKFFPSKEDLYMEILEKEESELRMNMEADLIRGSSLSFEGIKCFFMNFIDYMNQSPLILKMFQEQALDHLIRKLEPERIQKHMASDEVWSRKIFEDWQASGYLTTLDAEVFASLVRAVFILFTQKEALGAASFDRTMEFLIDSLAHEIIRSKALRP